MRLRKEDREFKATLGYDDRLCFKNRREKKIKQTHREAGKMVQTVKRLCKHEEPESDPRTHTEKLGVLMRVCKLRYGEVATEQVPVAWLPGSLT